MKKSIFAFAVIILMAGTIFTSCNSPEKKAEEAKEELKDAKQDLKEEIKAASAEEWTTFRTAVELKISENEVRIAELKVKIQKPGKVLDPLYAQRIETLEKKNSDLKAKLDSYEKNKSDWESFKREFNRDMDELGQSLKDFTIDNKK